MIERIEQALEDGITTDPATGQPLKFPDPADAPVEIEPGMIFWIRLDRELAGARGETGLIHPDAIENALDRWGIRSEINRDTAKRMLDTIASGRNLAMVDKIEPERQPRKPR